MSPLRSNRQWLYFPLSRDQRDKLQKIHRAKVGAPR